MNISEIKRRTASTETHFFDRKTMRFFGQRLSDFRVAKLESGLYRISAPMRDRDGRKMGYTVRLFDPSTNKLSLETKDAEVAE